MLKRHNLLLLDQEGREHACKVAWDENPLLDKKQIESLILSSIPAIVRRQENPGTGCIQVGFSSPHQLDGRRFRVGTEAPTSSVSQVITPYELIARLNDRVEPAERQVLEALVETGNKTGIALGIFGSLAMQVCTGLSYWTETSDLDICIKTVDTHADVHGFFQAVQELEKTYGRLLDIELQYRELYGIKLKELFGTQSTVLAKGLWDVEIFPIVSLGLL